MSRESEADLPGEAAAPRHAAGSAARRTRRLPARLAHAPGARQPGVPHDRRDQGPPGAGRPAPRACSPAAPDSSVTSGDAADGADRCPCSPCAPTSTPCPSRTPRSTAPTAPPSPTAPTPAATTCTPPSSSAPAWSSPSCTAQGLLPRPVRLIFQPAEEVLPGGAADAIESRRARRRRPDHRRALRPEGRRRPASACATAPSPPPATGWSSPWTAPAATPPART